MSKGIQTEDDNDNTHVNASMQSEEDKTNEPDMRPSDRAGRAHECDQFQVGQLFAEWKS